jgi:hypothetical protein
VVVEWRRGSRTRIVCGLGGPARRRSVPSDASAARGGSETVPLVECALTVTKAGDTSDVRRLVRMEAASGLTVRVLARLRPTGDGGKVGGLASVCTSSMRSTGHRCTRRKRPCV